MSVSSNKINYLIWRYLQESGHPLAALAIDKETNVGELDSEYEKTPPGELVRLVLKGLQMEEVEQQIAPDSSPTDLKPSKELAAGTTCVCRHGTVAIGTEQGSVIDGEIELDSNGTVTCLAWNSADQLAQGCISGQLRIWDRQGTLLRALNRHQSSIMLVEWNRNATHLLSADTSGQFCVWEGSSLVSEAKIPNFLSATWIDARTLAVSAGRDISVYKMDLSHPHTQFHGHMAPYSCLAFDSSSQLLASGADDGIVNAWHGRSQQPVRSLQGPAPALVLQWIPSAFASSDAITSKLLVAYAHSVALWDVDSSTQLWSIKLDSSFVCMAYHNEMLAIATTKLLVYKFETQPQLVGKFTPAKPITGVCWDKQKLYATSSGGSFEFSF